MEPQGDLHAASTYINNVLLARGLVKTGRPIDFANPENEEGGVTDTMARIINLVNDLVLRRDVSFVLAHGQGSAFPTDGTQSARQNIGRT